MEVTLHKILKIYEKEVRKNTKNKRKLYYFEKNKMQLCSEIYEKLLGNYDGGSYHVFTIYEPKERLIMAQGIVDKVINHYVAREMLLPKLEHFLDERNVATRKNKGLTCGINLLRKYLNQHKKEKQVYVLKIDLAKYFYSISHEVLKEQLQSIVDSDEFKLLEVIIDSTDGIYEMGIGLPIGNMTSQILSIFYLSELDHYIIHDLHLKYYVRYMDGATV